MASNNASVAAMLRIASSYGWRIARGSAGSLGFHEGAGSCADALRGSTVARSGALGRDIHIMRAKTITAAIATPVANPLIMAPNIRANGLIAPPFAFMLTR